MAKATFRIWRGDKDKGELRDYTTEASPLQIRIFRS